jgi:hypothetical protein
MAAETETAVEGWRENPRETAGLPPPSEAAPQASSVTLRLTPEGKLNLDSMSRKSRAKVAAIAGSAEFQREFGLVPGATDAAAVDPGFVASALDTLAQAQALMVSMRYKIPYALALQICAYTPQEKLAVTPPAQRVIAKHIPELYAKWGDELTLAAMLANLTVAKMRAAGQVAKLYHAGKLNATAQPSKTDGGAGASIPVTAPPEPSPVPIGD